MGRMTLQAYVFNGMRYSRPKLSKRAYVKEGILFLLSRRATLLERIETNYGETSSTQ